MKVGITGTRNGWTSPQCEAFMNWLGAAHEKITEIHHGDCIGVDQQVAEHILATYPIKLIVHPPSNPKNRAFTVYDQIREEFDYLTRNRHIVDEVDQLLVLPKQRDMVTRSGTWATYRYADAIGRDNIIFRPDGGVVVTGMLFGPQEE